MGNRAVIATSENNNEVGIYLHWNGGVESVLAFLDTCKNRGYRNPVEDSYGIARLIGVIHEFTGYGEIGLGVICVSYCDCDNGDNGMYIIDGNWAITERLYTNETQYKVIDLDEVQLKKYNAIMEFLKKSEENMRKLQDE